MFLRATNRKKDGEVHRYWSIVENRRRPGGRVSHRHVLYLGEINSSQEQEWRKSIEVFDEDAAQTRSLPMFPEDRNDEAEVDESAALPVAAAPVLPAHLVCLLVDAEAVGTAGVGSVLGGTPAEEPQGDTLGTGPVRAGRLPAPQSQIER